MKHGDFTELADNYAKYRPGYAPDVLETILAVTGRQPECLRGADIGAGTGIWTRMLARRGLTMSAVEPNDAMRAEGTKQNGDLAIDWHAGTAEHTTLPSGQFDLVSMASSFHWADFDTAVAEFRRLLKPGGLFLALWNTRYYESNPLLVRIEKKLYELVPDMKRVSSGRSTFCADLFDRLSTCGSFHHVLYLEGRHVEKQSIDHYIGLWKSVNDVQVQAGQERFDAFLRYILQETSGLDHIDAEYKTMAWLARCVA
jgi:ubiquinone/menaquinone biosynthesis C-methylase UbiE